MGISRTVCVAFAAVTVAATTPLVNAQDTNEQITVAFSDPSRPGQVSVASVTGNITVKGMNRRDVLIVARQRGGGRGRQTSGQSGGLRRLAQNAGFSVVEEGNVMRIESESPNRTLDFELQVPSRTNLKLETVNDGVINVDAVEGDLELENVNGSIIMTAVAGSVVANTVNGKVQATMTRVTAQKAMAFTTLNGNVDVTLPASTKANLRLRSDMGDIFTDFDVEVKPGSGSRPRDTRRDGGGKLVLEVNSSIFGTINGGGPEIELRTFNNNVYLRKGN